MLVWVPFHFLYLRIIFSSVYVAQWSSFVKELHTWFTVYSLCIISICSFSSFSFWFLVQDLGSDCSGFWSLPTFYVLCSSPMIGARFSYGIPHIA